MNLYSKAFYVVSTCETVDQCESALKYICLAAPRLPISDNENLLELWEMKISSIRKAK